jgi:hypothetical protein
MAKAKQVWLTQWRNPHRSGEVFASHVRQTIHHDTPQTEKPPPRWGLLCEIGMA